ncbi:hypothetical protein [Maribacter sp. IgM3_T14_3]|uniref:hypothetical protein n=1 Tax=Maribacter sp. IgM3_T14_3 TaxID=3415140 RepID=UPI003C6F0032
MNQILDIRIKPKVTIVFNEEKFEIIDAEDVNNNGIFLIDNLKNVEIIERKTNWFITILSFTVDLFTGSGSGSNYKDKAYLNIDFENRSVKIWLSNEDIDKANKAKDVLMGAILK